MHGGGGGQATHDTQLLLSAPTHSAIHPCDLPLAQRGSLSMAGASSSTLSVSVSPGPRFNFFSPTIYVSNLPFARNEASRRECSNSRDFSSINFILPLSCARAEARAALVWLKIFNFQGRADRRQSLGRRRRAVRAAGRDVENNSIDQLSEATLPDRWDVVGLGQAMVDFSGMVGEEFIEKLQLEKGTRKVINHEERGKVLRALDGCSFKASAGGSLSNTLVALARLGYSDSSSPALNVAMTGSVGGDPLGDFYRAKLLKANVHFLSSPIVDGTTGTVIVLTTPDAHRTMLSYQGMSSVVNFNSTLSRTISSAKILVVEGYLWEISQTIDAIAQACEAAHENGVLVALTASDVSCVARHRKQFWDVMALCTDILFTNSEEARAICGFGSNVSPALAAHHLSQSCPFVSVTDGARGSYVGVSGEVIYISPALCVPVDTCGAGDAYAAGILYGILKGVSDLKSMGNLAARVAAVVVGQQGTRLRQKDALELAFTSSPVGERIFEVTSLCNDIGADKI